MAKVAILKTTAKKLLTRLSPILGAGSVGT